MCRGRAPGGRVPYIPDFTGDSDKYCGINQPEVLFKLANSLVLFSVSHSLAGFRRFSHRIMNIQVASSEFRKRGIN